MYKVSVVVPIYNVEQYVGKCVDSILGQTYKDYELILVDDGSLDGSGKIADEYVLSDERITVYHKANGGLSDARNYGLDRARGEYICFIDSDDWIEDNYLYELVRLMDEYQADVVICDYKSNSGEGVISQPDKEEITQESGIEAIDNIWGSRYSEYVVAWNKMYRRTVFNDIRYTVGMIHEDEAICADIYCHASKVVRTNKILYNYRVNNSTSIMTTGYSLKRLDILKAIEIRMDILKNRGLQKYYEKDSFKYLYKIILNELEVKKLDGDNTQIIKELKQKYWNKYRESLSFDWSIKRKIAMLFFGIFPKAYLLRYKRNSK